MILDPVIYLLAVCGLLWVDSLSLKRGVLVVNWRYLVVTNLIFSAFICIPISIFTAWMGIAIPMFTFGGYSITVLATYNAIAAILFGYNMTGRINGYILTLSVLALVPMLHGLFATIGLLMLLFCSTSLSMGFIRVMDTLKDRRNWRIAISMFIGLYVMYVMVPARKRQLAMQKLPVVGRYFRPCSKCSHVCLCETKEGVQEDSPIFNCACGIAAGLAVFSGSFMYLPVFYSQLSQLPKTVDDLTAECNRLYTKYIVQREKITREDFFKLFAAIVCMSIVLYFAYNRQKVTTAPLSKDQHTRHIDAMKAKDDYYLTRQSIQVAPQRNAEEWNDYIQDQYSRSRAAVPPTDPPLEMKLPEVEIVEVHEPLTDLIPESVNPYDHLEKCRYNGKTTERLKVVLPNGEVVCLKKADNNFLVTQDTFWISDDAVDDLSNAISEYQLEGKGKGKNKAGRGAKKFQTYHGTSLSHKNFSRARARAGDHWEFYDDDRRCKLAYLDNIIDNWHDVPSSQWRRDHAESFSEEDVQFLAKCLGKTVDNVRLSIFGPARTEGKTSQYIVPTDTQVVELLNASKELIYHGLPVGNRLLIPDHQHDEVKFARYGDSTIAFEVHGRVEDKPNLKGLRSLSADRVWDSSKGSLETIGFFSRMLNGVTFASRFTIDDIKVAGDYQSGPGDCGLPVWGFVKGDFRPFLVGIHESYLSGQQINQGLRPRFGSDQKN